MKKLINRPESVVDEMCRGFVMAHGAIECLDKYRVLKKKAINRNKVTLISGGGSGHEPAHAGFIGAGMLDAAVCGDIFASPSQIQIYQAIKAAAGDKGVLLIVKNYSGDIMNFQNAALLAEMDGIKVASVKVSDDIAVMDSLYTVGRRGVAGTIFVHKAAGAAAEAGMTLDEVRRVAQKACDSVRSVGFAYSACTVPAKGSPTFVLAGDEMEYGVGIHGEPGQRRESILTADALAARMSEVLIGDLGLAAGERVALMINGFGATPLHELYIFNQAVVRELAGRKIDVHRDFVGNYMTSIEMAGASVSVMRLDDELETFIAAKADTPALTVTGNETPAVYTVAERSSGPEAELLVKADASGGNNTVAGDALSKANVFYLVDKMSEIIIENEVAFCELDAHAGDGDFGMSIAKGFKQLKREWRMLLEAHSASIGDFLEACSIIIMEHCGGASGPIWGFAFKNAGKQTAGKQSLSVADFADMMQAAVTGIQTVGEKAFGRGAVVGDKTLVDALLPCADSWTASAGKGEGMAAAFARGAAAAVEGAQKTADIVARMGRAGVVGERSLGYPDAGAHALGVIFTEIAKSMIFK